MRALWDIGVIIGIWCLFYVMLHARLWAYPDPKWLRNIRISAFVVVAALLSYSVARRNWYPEIPALLTLYGGTLLISINALSLCIRVERGNTDAKRNVPSALDAG